MEEERILDLFMDLPKEQDQSLLAQHIEKMEKTLKRVMRAPQERYLLAKSIENIDIIRQATQPQK